MLSAEQNALLARTGPRTPAGELFRRYWQPVALSTEVAPGGAPLPVRILSEELVLFRDESGRLGLLGAHCAHRGTDLSYGRVEDGGLRCLYHGWLYDVSGRCLEQPGEPAGSRFCEKIRQLAYPCLERAGLVFAYLGPGDPPLLPAYEPLAAPEGHTYVWKILGESNWLQASEGNIDPAHTSFLHQQFAGPSATPTVPGSDQSLVELYGEDVAPRLEVEATRFGVRIYTIRQLGADRQFYRVSNFLLPNASVVTAATGSDGYGLFWYVPIDDTHHWKYTVNFQRSRPVDTDAPIHRLYRREVGPDFRLRRNRSNRYGQDRAELRDVSFAGMGPFFPVHDAFAYETQGAVQDRTQEHLGYTDKAIIAARRALLSAIRQIQAGQEPPNILRDPVKNAFPDLDVMSEVVPATDDWRSVWQRWLVAGRQGLAPSARTPGT